MPPRRSSTGATDSKRSSPSLRVRASGSTVWSPWATRGPARPAPRSSAGSFQSMARGGNLAAATSRLPPPDGAAVDDLGARARSGKP